MKIAIITLSILFYSLLYAEHDRDISITIVPGEKWIHKMKIAFFKIDLRPQMAIWIESETSKKVKCIWVTKNTGKQKWKGAKTQENDKPFRKYALPVWLHKYKEEFNRFPTINNPVCDGITSATPKNGFTKQIDFLFEGENQIYFEINNSFDTNLFFTNKPTDNGQPSLIYKTTLSDSSKKGNYPLKLIGTDSHNGEDGEIDMDLSRITDAKDILRDVFITIK